MAYWIVEVRDTDGNDCTVLDWIVRADSANGALDAAMTEAMRRAPDAEEDGGFGAYYPCDCEIPEGDEFSWECSHGGFSLDENPQGPFDSADEAMDATAIYHTRETINE